MNVETGAFYLTPADIAAAKEREEPIAEGEVGEAVPPFFVKALEARRKLMAEIPVLTVEDQRRILEQSFRRADVDG